jgi:hypothetical protein
MPVGTVPGCAAGRTPSGDLEMTLPIGFDGCLAHGDGHTGKRLISLGILDRPRHNALAASICRVATTAHEQGRQQQGQRYGATHESQP